MPKQFTKTVIHPLSMRVIPESSYMLCEACGKEMRMADAYSYPAVIALSGPDIHVSTACEEEQHFGCSHVCALKLHNQCIEEHLQPKVQQALERATIEAAQAAQEQAQWKAVQQKEAELAVKAAQEAN